MSRNTSLRGIIKMASSFVPIVIKMASSFVPIVTCDYQIVITLVPIYIILHFVNVLVSK